MAASSRTAAPPAPSTSAPPSHREPVALVGHLEAHVAPRRRCPAPAAGRRPPTRPPPRSPSSLRVATRCRAGSPLGHPPAPGLAVSSPARPGPAARPARAPPAARRAIAADPVAVAPLPLQHQRRPLARARTPARASPAAPPARTCNAPRGQQLQPRHRPAIGGGDGARPVATGTRCPSSPAGSPAARPGRRAPRAGSGRAPIASACTSAAASGRSSASSICGAAACGPVQVHQVAVVAQRLRHLGRPAGCTPSSSNCGARRAVGGARTKRRRSRPCRMSRRAVSSRSPSRNTAG